MSFSVVILAAGQGRRMRSTLPKVLHCIAGIPILERIISTVKKLKPQQIIVVYGHEGAQLKEKLAHHFDLLWAHQAEQLGTGHALRQALPLVGAVKQLLVLPGDVPFIAQETLEKFIAGNSGNSGLNRELDLGLVTAQVENPSGLGRILRDEKGQIVQVVEEKDATLSQKEIREISAGIWLFPKDPLQRWVSQLTQDNAQREYYLPQVLVAALQEGAKITSFSPPNSIEILGVNDKVELASLERLYQKQQAVYFMQQGVTIYDPHRFDLRGQLTVGEEVTIDVNVVFEGEVQLGNRVSIGPNVVIKNAILQDGVQVLANTLIEGAVIAEQCCVGPFARIRPGTELLPNARVGNFVELKKAKVGRKSKINHLSYIGDAVLGEEVNIGAGTITCNFDGEAKHQTIIGDRVFIGSDTQLIAPLTIGEGATVGAGTTVAKDIPANQLMHNRVEHRKVENWARETKTKSEPDTRNS